MTDCFTDSMTDQFHDTVSNYVTANATSVVMFGNRRFDINRQADNYKALKEESRYWDYCVIPKIHCHICNQSISSLNSNFSSEIIMSLKEFIQALLPKNITDIVSSYIIDTSEMLSAVCKECYLYIVKQEREIPLIYFAKEALLSDAQLIEVAKSTLHSRLASSNSDFVAKLHC